MKFAYAKRAAAIVAGVALSALPLDAANVQAAPSDPAPPCINCQPGPGGGPAQSPSMNGPGIDVPGSPGIEPPVGGGPKTGGRSVG